MINLIQLIKRQQRNKLAPSLKNNQGIINTQSALTKLCKDFLLNKKVEERAISGLSACNLEGLALGPIGILVIIRKLKKIVSKSSV